MQHDAPNYENRRVLIGVFCAGALAGALTEWGVRGSMRRYESVDDMPGWLFKQRATIAGRVTKVSDGDTLRVQHLPLLASAPTSTLKIRLCAVDAPETAHFGKAGQPLGETAKAFSADRVEGKRVRLRLLSRDRYGRAVARVTYRGNWCGRRDLSEDLLAAGLATVYHGGGAQYDAPDASHWEAIEAKAKQRELGIWRDPEANNPAAYKKRQHS